METKPCATCGQLITGARQRKFCRPCRNARYRVTTRWLEPGEQVPPDEPHRYPSSHGYIRLRWRIGRLQHVETYEHRVFDGRVTEEEHVHHVNGNRSDNRPENLRPLSSAEHEAIHGNPRWWVQAARAYTSGLSTYQVGKRLGKNPATVYRALVKMGVAIRKDARIATPRREVNGD